MGICGFYFYNGINGAADAMIGANQLLANCDASFHLPTSGIEVLKQQ
jgi:hypothetical protein